jgi:hypothetical protein
VGGVGGADVQRGRIVGGIYGDGGKPGVARGACDTNGDLAAVGDQQFMEGHLCFRWIPFGPTFPAQNRRRFSFLLPDMKPCCDADASGILFRTTEITNDPLAIDASIDPLLLSIQRKKQERAGKSWPRHPT